MLAFMVQQASPEWWEVRRGIPTASEFDRIITPAKGDVSTSAKKYIAELIAVTLLPTANYFSQYGFVNPAIEEGKEREAESRKWLSFDLGQTIDEVGFVMNDDFTLGCSPDGLLGLEVAPEAAGEWRGIPYFKATATAGVELKNPKQGTQAMRVYEDRSLPLNCKVQPHGQMIVCGVKTIHWASYAPPLPALRIDVQWDHYTAKVEAAVNEFVGLYKAALEKVRQR